MIVRHVECFALCVYERKRGPRARERQRERKREIEQKKRD